MRRAWIAPVVAALALGGCGPAGRVKEEDIVVKEETALNQAKKLLEAYSKGQPLGSESTSFEYLVNEVRKTDARRADILQKGFADLQKMKGGTAGKAKDVLTQLAPQQNPD